MGTSTKRPRGEYTRKEWGLIGKAQRIRINRGRKAIN